MISSSRWSSSVVTALSLCGRFSHTRAISPSFSSTMWSVSTMDRSFPRLELNPLQFGATGCRSQGIGGMTLGSGDEEDDDVRHAHGPLGEVAAHGDPDG